MPVAPETVRGISEEVGRGTLVPQTPKREHFVESWLQDHLNAVAYAVVAAGFGLRLFVATRTYLNPDEALHYQIINQHSAWLAYKASLSNAHPPLIFLILYFWHFLGRSELVLRIPSVILGTACCWMGFKWVKTVFGKAAGLIALILFAFSPAMVALSAEVRGYALLLFCMTTSLYFLARALDDKSAGKMWYFSIFLYLAIVSHYSAIFYAVAIGLYAQARLVDSQFPRNVVVAWIAGQLGAFAIYVFLYVTHVSKLKNSIPMWSMPFEPAYFHSYSQTIIGFTTMNTRNIFLFLFGQKYVAHIILLLFAAAVLYFFVRDLLFLQGNRQTGRSGILLSFPFIAVWGAALVGIYPYVGSRHTVFLAPFVIAGVSFLLAGISRRKLWAGLLIAILLMAWSNTSAKPVEPSGSAGEQTPAMMAAAVTYMDQTIPQGDPIFVDMQSSLPISYYFCGTEIVVQAETFGKTYFEFACKGHPIISLHFWKAMAATFSPHFETMAHTHGLKPGDRVWVFQTGWGLSLSTELPKYDSRFRCLAPKNFGSGIAVIPFIVGPDLLPVTPSQSCPN